MGNGLREYLTCQNDGPGGETISLPLGVSGYVAEWALIDASDLPWLMKFNWRLSSRGYVITGGFTTVRLHRLILGLVPGDGLEGDHVNRNRLDNRRSNLRIGSRALNGQNVPARGRHRGVNWDPVRNKWRARVKLNRCDISLGRFDSESEAIDVVRAFRAEHMPFSEDASQ